MDNAHRDNVNPNKEISKLEKDLMGVKEELKLLQATHSGMLVDTQWFRRVVNNIEMCFIEIDCNEARSYLLRVKEKAGGDFGDYLQKHPEVFREVLLRSKVLNVNNYALKLFHATDVEDFQSSIGKYITITSWPKVIDLMVATTDGSETFVVETTLKSMDDRLIPIYSNFCLHTGDFDYGHILWLAIDISGQKDAEEEMKRSEERLKMILRAIPDMIFLFDREGYYLDFYATDHSKLAVSSDKIIGSHIKDIFPKEIVDKSLAAFHAALENGDLQIIQYDLELPSGNAHFEARIVAAGPDEVIALATDITERKIAENVLQKSEQFYKELFANVNDAILIIEPETEKIIAANAKASEIYGYSIEELLRMSLRKLTKTPEKGKSQISNALKNNSFKNFESIHYNRKGEEIDFLINGSIVDYNDKKSLLIINHDITDLKKAEKVKNATYRISELALTAKSLDDLFLAIHKIIEELMPARNIYIALYDREQEQLSFPYFVDEHDQAPQKRGLKKGLTEYVLRTGISVLTNPALIGHLVAKGEIEIIGTLTYDWLGVPLKSNDQIIGVLAVQSYRDDIQYTESNKQILIFVSEQVAMAIDRRMKEEELKMAKETAEESSKLKSTLLANLSHEFRTPMNGILNYARIIKESGECDNLSEMADTIISSGNRLLSTLDSIMYLAQIEASNIRLEIRRYDIGKELESTMLHYEGEARVKNLDFEFQIEQGIEVYGDLTFIVQIAKYLLDNAIKFTTKGKVSVFLKTTLMGDRHWAELEVRDTGPGIAKSDLDVIFHEFRQLSSGYSRTHEGSGLGLTLCKKMAELMNGRITVESMIGKGSSFYFRIPQAEESSGKTQPVSGKRKIKEKTSVGSVPSRFRDSSELAEVLIVEDNQVNMELTVMFLRDVCHTDKARDAQTAIRMAKEKLYDVILMDINLGPGMNGLEAAQEIKKIKGYEQTPIVAVTGYTMSGDREKMLQGGCTHYLPKPFDKKGIVRMVEEVLRKE